MLKDITLKAKKKGIPVFGSTELDIVCTAGKEGDILGISTGKTVPIPGSGLDLIELNYSLPVKAGDQESELLTRYVFSEDFVVYDKTDREILNDRIEEVKSRWLLPVSLGVGALITGYLAVTVMRSNRKRFGNR